MGTTVRTYKIARRGNQWCVLNRAGTRTIKCHPTRQEALDQLRAIEARKSENSDMANTDKVEEFSFGGRRTTIDSFHFHGYSEDANFTLPPFGIPEGHMHEIIRDSDGVVTGFGTAAGHSHSMEPVTEFEEEEEPQKFRVHGGGSSGKRKKKKKQDMEDATEEDEDLIEKKKSAINASGKEEDEEEISQEYADDKGHSLKGIEIFRTGVWNGDRYTTKDLDEMVAAFGKAGFQPPIKLGHKEKSGDRAFGWVKNLRRVGRRLVADFVNIPSKLFEVIKDRGYDTVSSEIYWDLKRNGKIFPRVLKAVALLGAEVPAVSDLKPLRKSLSEDTDIDFVKIGVCNLASKELKMPKIKQYKKSKAPDKALSAEDVQGQITELEKKIEEEEDEELAAIYSENLEDKKLVYATLKEKEEAEEEAGKVAEKDETIRELTEKLEDASTKITTLQEADDKRSKRERKLFCKSATDAVTIPALRPYFASLFSSAMEEGDKVVKFTQKVEGKDVETESTVVDVLKELRDAINTSFAKHFKEQSTDGSGDDDDNTGNYEDISNKVDEKTKAYVKEHKVKYDIALQKVLEDDADLRKAYYRGRN